MRLRTFIFCLTLIACAPAWAETPVRPLHKPERTEKPVQPVAVTQPEAAKSSKKARFKADHIGEMKSYTTLYEDTLVKIARDYDVGFVELRAANPDVDPWLPGANVELTLPTMHLIPDAPRSGIVINLAEMRLYHFRKNETPVSYPIGIGREGLQTPLGATTVRAKKENPTWRPTPRMRKEDPTLPESVPPGPENPMGTHVMYLGWPEYGIHGTNKPYGIGRRSSSGCIRMYPEDIVKLFPSVKEGDGVTVVNQPVKAAWVGDSLYVEAHPTMEQANKIETEGGFPAYEMSDADMAHIMKAAGSVASDLDWRLIRKIIRERKGYPVVVAKKPAPATASEDEPKKTDGVEEPAAS